MPNVVHAMQLCISALDRELYLQMSHLLLTPFNKTVLCHHFHPGQVFARPGIGTMEQLQEAYLPQLLQRDLGILSGEHTGSGLVMLRRAGVHLAAKTKMECKPPRRGANGRHVLSVKLCRIRAFIQDHHPKIQMPVLWSVSWWAVFCSMAFSRQDQLIIQTDRGVFFQTLTCNAYNST